MSLLAITTDRFEVVAPAYADVGLDPVPLPCIRAESAAEAVLEEARRAALGADLLIVTSARTVELLWPQSPMPPVEVAAVGETTAAAIALRGGRTVLVGRSGLAALTEAAADRLASTRVVFPHGSGADAAALTALRIQARHLLEFDVYVTVPVAPGRTTVEAVVFASPSAVNGWLLSRDLRGLVVGVIGPTTCKTVSGHRPPDVVAPDPSHQALARAMASYLEVEA